MVLFSEEYSQPKGGLHWRIMNVECFLSDHVYSLFHSDSTSAFKLVMPQINIETSSLKGQIWRKNFFYNFLQKGTYTFSKAR